MTDADQFNYGQVAVEKAEELRQLADMIRAGGHILTRTAVQIGGFLISAKVGLKRGLFLQWCRLEARYEPRTAQLYMNLADLFERYGDDVYLVPLSAALKLAAPSVDEATVEEVLARARCGERLTIEAVEDCIRRAQSKESGPLPVGGAEMAIMVLAALDRTNQSKLRVFLGDKPGPRDRQFMKHLRERLTDNARQNVAGPHQLLPLHRLPAAGGPYVLTDQA